jgi:hypothetical protein
MIPVTENELRAKVVGIMRGWLGRNEANGGHKEIIDIYNAHPRARGYKVKYTDEWCATTVSAAFIQAGLTKIAPTECGCGEMVKLYQAIGRWIEDDNHSPTPGDVVMYDWDDTNNGDNRGWPDHVGIVESVSRDTITVIEGNKNAAVARRTLQRGQKYIRGYCCPDYASVAENGPDAWAEASWNKANAKGVLDGTRPRDALSRQELAVILDRLTLI